MTNPTTPAAAGPRPKIDIANSKWVRYFPLGFIAMIVACKLVSQGRYWEIFCAEDGPIEYMTSLAHLTGMAVAWAVAYRLIRQRGLTRQSVLLGVIGLGMFFVAMEEISWGQRLIGVESPEFFQQHNVQQEITIHNFLTRYPLHMTFILAGLYGAFAWRLVPRRLRERWPDLAAVMIPPKTLRWYFLPVALLYLYYDYISALLVDGLGLTAFAWDTGRTGWIVAKDQEPAEFILAMGAMAFMLIIAQNPLPAARPKTSSDPTAQTEPEPA